MAEQDKSNIKQDYNNATVGLNLDQTLNQIKKGSLTYALNAAVENFDSNSVNYQNEEGNELCLNFPEDFVLIGTYFILEKNKHIFFLTNPETGDSEIGYMENNSCEYKTLVNSPCLDFSVNYPIQKVQHKSNNCGTEIYWADGHNYKRYLDIDNPPRKLQIGSSLCDPIYTEELDCNQLSIQPMLAYPTVSVGKVTSNGTLIAGTYQFSIQYADALGNPYTSYYSVTNPLPIADTFITTVDFNYPVGKSIVVNVSNLDGTGQFQYFNLAVIKTINGISSVELVGTYNIDSTEKQITYTGADSTNIRLTIEDIFEEFPYYDIANDVTAVQDVLIWSDLTAITKVNYQDIASKIHLMWETWRIPPTENYSDGLNATDLRGYLRDEVYPFEIVFLLKSGRETDSFHIPGRAKNSLDVITSDIPDTDPDFVGSPAYTLGGVGYSPYWMIYNTASVTGYSAGYSSDSAYKGPYQIGEFAYTESTEEYPCNVPTWGALAGQKIKHHKFPDVLVSPIYESKMFLNPGSMVMGNDAIFPIGVHVDPQQIQILINTSNLTIAQKAEVIGYKIVRGDRSTNKSIVAKGILRNVGMYEREKQKFYYPNYPYNDLTTDPFLSENNNAFSQICEVYTITVSQLGIDPLGGPRFATLQYIDCNTGRQEIEKILSIDPFEKCSIGKPTILSPAEGTVTHASYEIWSVYCIPWAIVTWEDPILGTQTESIQSATINVVSKTGGPREVSDVGSFEISLIGIHAAQSNCASNITLPSIETNSSLAYRQIFNSPETSFGQPFLGDILKLENVMFGAGSAHFVEVKNNARYKLITEYAQRIALDSSNKLGSITDTFDATAMFAAYQAYLTIYINGITRKNYGYSFNSIADYNYSADIPNGLGIKQRDLDIVRYLIPGVESVGDDHSVNNYQRESSVYLRTNQSKKALPYPDKTINLAPGGTSIVSDDSRFTISEVGNCSTPAREHEIQVVSYYASLKNSVPNQWGQIYSYELIDTGFQHTFNNSLIQSSTIFGGDTFISRFAFKTKLPFFIDNRVGAPDDSDIFYDEIGNIAYPLYWHSARSILKDYTSGGGVLSNIIAYKAHNFDCPNDGVGFDKLTTIPINTSSTTTSTSTLIVVGPVTNSSTLSYYDGYFYLFAYGIPNFYCESSYNTDLRQAFNNREGDFWPHVSTGIPDDWQQENFVSIANDNTYTYNTTFSKQNRENTFSHLPIDWEKICYTKYPFRAIYSDSQNTSADNRVNAWLTYRAISFFDFPQNYGRLTSLDGIQNRAILARFENKSLLYNNLLVIDTSNPQSAYVGSPELFRKTPPIDFAETDLGYVGSQHKMLLKLPQGQLTVDAKRGQVFLIAGTEVTELSGFGSGMNRFFTDHLAFEILNFFPTVDVDNNFTGIGLHAVYDSKYERVILTKLDYVPICTVVQYDEITKSFYTEEQIGSSILKTPIKTTDSDYFCNKSWTLSYNLNLHSWISFHSYLPNWYIGESNFFYSGINGCCGDLDFVVGVPVAISTTTSTTTVCRVEFRTLKELPLTTTTLIPISTTTSTTIRIINCNLTGSAIYIAPPITTSTTTSIPLVGLELTFFDSNVPVANINSLANWNTYFNLPIHGSVFTSIVVTGNVVLLLGGANIYMRDGMFSNASFPFGAESYLLDPNTGEHSYLVSIKDYSGVIIQTDSFTFAYTPYLDGISSKLNTVFLPAVVQAFERSFAENTALVNINMGSLLTADNNCFYHCSSVVNFQLPKLVTADYSCFSECTGVVTFNLPKLVTAGDQCFSMSYSNTCTSMILPLVESLGVFCFAGNLQLEIVYIPSCLFLGPTTGFDYIFYYINEPGNHNMTITLPTALMTCNSGQPDADLGTTSLPLQSGIVARTFRYNEPPYDPTGFSVTVITV